MTVFRSDTLSEPLSVAIAQSAEHRIVDTLPVRTRLLPKSVKAWLRVPSGAIQYPIRSREPLSVVCGPCPCQGCRNLVVWTGTRWVDRDGSSHRCVA